LPRVVVLGHVVLRRRPVWPWAVVAATPALLALVGGFIGLVSGRRRLFRFCLIGPIAIGFVTFFLAPALF
jgi:hypothetical protein